MSIVQIGNDGGAGPTHFGPPEPSFGDGGDDIDLSSDSDSDSGSSSASDESFEGSQFGDGFSGKKVKQPKLKSLFKPSTWFHPKYHLSLGSEMCRGYYLNVYAENNSISRLFTLCSPENYRLIFRTILEYYFSKNSAHDFRLKIFVNEKDGQPVLVTQWNGGSNEDVAEDELHIADAVIDTLGSFQFVLKRGAEGDPWPNIHTRIDPNACASLIKLVKAIVNNKVASEDAQKTQTEHEAARAEAEAANAKLREAEAVARKAEAAAKAATKAAEEAIRAKTEAHQSEESAKKAEEKAEEAQRHVDEDKIGAALKAKPAAFDYASVATALKNNQPVVIVLADTDTDSSALISQKHLFTQHGINNIHIVRGAIPVGHESYKELRSFSRAASSGIQVMPTTFVLTPPKDVQKTDTVWVSHVFSYHPESYFVQVHHAYIARC